ncbi:MAG: cysteine desulfurase [Candidatus Micrarchaeia archaeon]
MDVERIRGDFPILKTGVVYFDNAASSLTPEQVIGKEIEFYREYRANIHRGAHRLTRRASEEYEGVRRKLSKFFNAKDGMFINCNNTTLGINLVALGLDFQKGDEILVSSLEHHSNLLPWQRVERKCGAKIGVFRASLDGAFDANAFVEKINSKTKLVAVTAASNVLGTAPDVEKISKAAKDAGCLVLVDGAQVAGHRPVDLSKIRADYFVFSGHKALGPTGSGALFVRNGAPLEAPLLGGGTAKNADFHSFVPEEGAERFEAGTPNIAGFIGLGAALDYLSALGLENVRRHEIEMTKIMLKRFGELEQSSRGKVKLFGPRDPAIKGAVFPFVVKGMDAHQAAVMCDELQKVCVRSGMHCAAPLHALLGVEGTARASLHVYNTEKEIGKFFEALEMISKL